MLNDDLKKYLEIYFDDKVKSFFRLGGGKNNHVFKITFYNYKNIIIKNYYSDINNNLDRLNKEWIFLSHAKKIEPKCVPTPINFNKNLNIACYSFIAGRKFKDKEIDKKVVQDACQFIKKINKIPFEFEFHNATESCLDLESHFKNIDFRVNNISKEICSNNLLTSKIIDLVKLQIIPLWDKISVFNKKIFSNKKINIKKYLSPSDFGFHNILKSKKNINYFIDFEYSGMDDLAKLTNDFFCTPDIPVNEKYYNFFISEMVNNLDLDNNYIFRSKNLIYSYKLKWICIMLKQITNIGILKRNHLNINSSPKIIYRDFKRIETKLIELKEKFRLETS